MSSGNDPSSSHRRLLLKGHGYPLYASKYGVQIGDVGVVTRDCSFDVFFNIYEPATRDGVPHGFKVVSVDNSEDNLVSQVFPDGTSRTDLASVSLTASRERALKQGESWYDFVREQVEIGSFGSGVQNGELYVITGVKNAQSTTAESQNMFIRGFKIAVRSLPFKLNNDEPYHPADAINQKLLEMSYGAVVLTHDDEWTSVLTAADEEFPQSMELISRILKKYTIHCNTIRSPSRSCVQLLDALEGGAYLVPSSSSGSSSSSSTRAPTPTPLWTMDQRLLTLIPGPEPEPEPIPSLNELGLLPPERTAKRRRFQLITPANTPPTTGAGGEFSAFHSQPSQEEEPDSRSRNAQAQAKHRAKVKAHIENAGRLLFVVAAILRIAQLPQLEDTVLRLQIAAAAATTTTSMPQLHDAQIPAALSRIRDLEHDNAVLENQNATMRRWLWGSQLAQAEEAGAAASI